MEDPQLTVGASNIPANYLIPGLLPILATRHPGIVLSVIAGDSRDIIGRLRAGDVALAVVGGRCERRGQVHAAIVRYAAAGRR